MCTASVAVHVLDDVVQLRRNLCHPGLGNFSNFYRGLIGVIGFLQGSYGVYLVTSGVQAVLICDCLEPY